MLGQGSLPSDILFHEEAPLSPTQAFLALTSPTPRSHENSCKHVYRHVGNDSKKTAAMLLADSRKFFAPIPEPQTSFGTSCC